VVVGEVEDLKWMFCFFFSWSDLDWRMWSGGREFRGYLFLYILQASCDLFRYLSFHDRRGRSHPYGLLVLISVALGSKRADMPQGRMKG